jgi:predicted nucleic acid-binding protein
MVLVDTSVWVAHFRATHIDLVRLLNNGEVVCHPFIIGELGCGNLKNRNTILSLLRDLPAVSILDHEEVLAFIEGRKLMGKGLGYIDVHLLASAVLSGISIWTLDKRLEQIAGMLECKHNKKNR